MQDVIIQLLMMLGVGSLFRFFSFGRLDVETLRKALAEIVFYLFLPALVLRVLWRSSLGLESVQISLVAASGILSSMFLSWLVCRGCRTERQVTGAVILAASFGNFTYLGIPVLVSVFGDWAAGVAIQYDLFASTPILFTVGFMLAAYFGKATSDSNPLVELFRIPALWAAVIAVVLNLSSVPLPNILDGLLQLLSSAVIPLMLVAVGMSLQSRSLKRKNFTPVLIIIVVQLLFMPLVVLLVSQLLGMEKQVQIAVVLEAAMPSMVIGLVICERYRLDTAVYAAAVTVTTLISLLSLPVWYLFLH